MTVTDALPSLCAQLEFVAVGVNVNAAGWVMVMLFMVVHPFASVTVTV